jgi:hypothetical protein
MATWPTGSSSPRPSASRMKPRISTTHRRPSASKLTATGDSMSGSAATSSTRKPGATLKRLASSSAVSGGAGSGFTATPAGSPGVAASAAAAEPAGRTSNSRASGKKRRRAGAGALVVAMGLSKGKERGCVLSPKACGDPGDCCSCFKAGSPSQRPS